MEKQFFHQVTGEPEVTFFERITEDFLFWDDIRANINCALLLFQDICAMRLCSNLVKKAREKLDKDAINAFSVSFVEAK